MFGGQLKTSSSKLKEIPGNQTCRLTAGPALFRQQIPDRARLMRKGRWIFEMRTPE